MYGVSDTVVGVVFPVVEVIVVFFVDAVCSIYGVRYVVSIVLDIGIVIVAIIVGNMVFGGMLVVVSPLGLLVDVVC